MMKHIYRGSTTPPKNIYRLVDDKPVKIKTAWRAISSTEYVKVWDISQDKYVSRIYIAQNPTILWYQIGEAYDLTGLVVKAVWSDGTETDITEEINDQLPTGEVTYSGLSSETYNYSKYVDISYSTKAGIKKTRLTLTVNS